MFICNLQRGLNQSLAGELKEVITVTKKTTKTQNKQTKNQNKQTSLGFQNLK